MKKVRFTKKYSCEDLNRILNLPVKLVAISRRGEDLELTFDSDNDALVTQAADKVIEQLNQWTSSLPEKLELKEEAQFKPEKARELREKWNQPKEKE